MTDRELLELAAKAAGIRLEWDGHPDKWQPMYYQGKTYHSFDPLTDDGDALRLFCAIPWMCIETSDMAATVRERGNPDHPSRVYLMWTEWLDKHNGDLHAATRRAIVRAAASIGESA